MDTKCYPLWAKDSKKSVKIAMKTNMNNNYKTCLRDNIFIYKINMTLYNDMNLIKQTLNLKTIRNTVTQHICEFYKKMKKDVDMLCARKFHIVRYYEFSYN